MDDYVYKYTGYITTTDTPQPLSAEWGEDVNADAVDTYNPLFMIADGTAGDPGAATLAGAANSGDILIGDRTSQHRVFMPGGNTGQDGVNKLSDVWVRTRTPGNVIRIEFKVYKKRK